MNKKIIFINLLIITQAYHSLCMKTEVKKQNYSNESYIPRSTWNVFGYLNWHNSPFQHTINMCDEVEKLVKSGIDVNKKEISMMSRFHNMTPLEVAITESKCEKCIALLRKHGAQDTEYIRYWQEHYSNK